MKLKVQAQHLQAGDIVGSGEKVGHIILNSIHWDSSKCYVHLLKNGKQRGTHWGKYTMINIERPEKVPNATTIATLEAAERGEGEVITEDSKEYFDRYVAGDR